MVDPAPPVPEHLHTVTPRLVFRKEASAAPDFYARAFGARLREEPYRTPDGAVVHAEIQIGNSVVYLTDEGDDADGAAPATVGGRVTALLALNVPNVDEVWEHAIAAGCEAVYPLADQFYGARAGRVRDPFGHQWMLSTHTEDVPRDELERRIRAYSEEDT